MGSGVSDYRFRRELTSVGVVGHIQKIQKRLKARFSQHGRFSIGLVYILGSDMP